MSTTETPGRVVNRLRDLKVGVRDLIMLDPRTIKIEEGHNPRNYGLKENRAHLDFLKESIRDIGTQQPLWVRYEPSTKEAILVDGECRLRANLELIEEGVEIESVPTIQVSNSNVQERAFMALVANTGKSLSEWEQGAKFRQFVGWGWSVEKLAAKLKYDVSYIERAIELADADPAVLELLSQEAVTPALAQRHIRKHGSEAAVTLTVAAETAKAAGKEIATTRNAPKAPGAKRYTDTDALALIGTLREIHKESTDKRSRQAALDALENAGAV